MDFLFENVVALGRYISDCCGLAVLHELQHQTRECGTVEEMVCSFSRVLQVCLQSDLHSFFYS